MKEYEGIVSALMHWNNDIEGKLLVSKYKNRYTKEQIEALVEFQERFFVSGIIMG